jgi:predicted Zn-ribbon and HTH transcriptional regulator
MSDETYWQMRDRLNSLDDQVKCPRCKSTQVHAEKRGWSLGSGLIGSGAIRITCLKCGHKFKPGRGA